MHSSRLVDDEVLKKRNLLTSEQIQRLADCGISTYGELVAVGGRKPGQRDSIAERIVISDDDLLLACGVANVLAVQGPGATYAHARAEGMELADLTKPDERDKWLAFISLNRRQMLELLAEDEDCIAEQLEAAKRYGGIRKTLLSWLLLCLLVPVSVLLYRSSRVFTPVTDNIIQQTRDGFLRDGVWIEAKIAMAIVLGVIIFGLCSMLVSYILGKGQQKIWKSYLSPQDRLIVVEAGTTVSPQLSELIEWPLRNMPLVMLVVAILYLGARMKSPSFLLTSPESGFIAIVASTLITVSVMNGQLEPVRRFGRKVAWVSPTKERFAEMQTIRIGLAICVSVLMISFLLVPLLQAGIQWASDWNQQQQSVRLADFDRALAAVEVAPEQQEEWTAAQANWQAWGKEEMAASLDSLASTEQFARSMWDFGRIVAAGLLGIMLAFSIVEFSYRNWSKGVASLALWAITLLASEFLPDKVMQFLGISDFGFFAIILTIGLAGFLSMLTEFGSSRAARGKEAMCPNFDCNTVVTADHIYCSHCGTRIEPDYFDVEVPDTKTA